MFFEPSPARAMPGTTEPAMKYGIFLGYRLAPGDRWHGEFLVAYLEDFANQPLTVTQNHQDFDLYPHITKSVRCW